MLIAIDGPAGSGKSTVARAVQEIQHRVTLAVHFVSGRRVDVHPPRAPQRLRLIRHRGDGPGAVALNPVEVAGMYQTIASGGFGTPLRAIRDVLANMNVTDLAPLEG